MSSFKKWIQKRFWKNILPDGVEIKILPDYSVNRGRIVQKLLIHVAKPEGIEKVLLRFRRTEYSLTKGVLTKSSQISFAAFSPQDEKKHVTEMAIHRPCLSQENKRPFSLLVFELDGVALRKAGEQKKVCESGIPQNSVTTEYKKFGREGILFCAKHALSSLPMWFDFHPCRRIITKKSLLQAKNKKAGPSNQRRGHTTLDAA